MAALKQRSKNNRGKRKSERSRKVVRSVARATSRSVIAASEPLLVPTRWVKFVFAIFLLPICAILSQTFFTAFARATMTQRLWAGEEFWFFSLGAVLWLIAFFGLPRPIVIYVFGHELTHALWVWLMGGRVSRFRVGRDGGHVVTSKANFWIALAPYFFPLYSILAIGTYGVFSLFVNVQPYGRLLYAVIGATWAFHFTFTCWMIPKNQTDLSDQGTFFSLVVIYLMNLLLLSAMLILASPQITFASFGADLLTNLSNFAQWMVELFHGMHGA
ncbi:MAG: hypothetical protein DME20_04325 [Verrucomicrobia bacterium]|nr:MAG: hypothetical protein DME74_02805 [Verrucomicrobiota bacterium]PYK50407.1 MAG: hypothetical protein DME20_04325 [Verrucomicrobiota bacterium]PYL44508.1 MAG: hypothetical protein DMF42_00850 [Verrucomicrobiota bacterium]